MGFHDYKTSDGFFRRGSYVREMTDAHSGTGCEAPRDAHVPHAKICELDCSIAREKHVCALDVPVEDAAAVQVRQAEGSSARVSYSCLPVPESFVLVIEQGSRVVAAICERP